jgi:hypothetical protein
VVLTVERATKRRADAEDRVATARDNQTDAIVEALNAGVSVSTLATITGLSAARIYQIKSEAKS